MTRPTEKYLWIIVFSVLVTLAIPWFFWGTDRLVVGLPIWVWWHIAWMVIAAITFHLFASRAWGIGIEEEPS